MPRVSVDIVSQLSGAGLADAQRGLQGVSGAASSADRAILANAAALSRLQRAAGDAAAAERTMAAALGQIDRNSREAIAAEARLIAEHERLARASREAGEGMQALPRTFAGITSGVAATITGMVSLGAAMEAGKAIAQSFIDAFKFKAELDATTASINAQLQGVRDSSQVYAAAAAFGREFKLTQEEQTQAISASIGVIRQSKAPIEDILSVLARMQILSPEQSLQEAAIALKGLAGGDTQSLVTRFEVSRDRANEMKAAIQGGADSVQVMSQFLNETGIGMDALRAKTEGAAGAMKNVALAQEELKLAQAEFAQGPGLAIIGTQIEATMGLTRLLTGDFEAMGASATQSAIGAIEAMIRLGEATGMPIGEIEALRATQRALMTDTEALDGLVQGSSGTWGESAVAISYQSQSMIDAANAAAQLMTQHAALVTITQDAANASLIDAANKEYQAAQTQLLQAETNAAVDAFLALHPGISASGVAALAMAGQINPLLAQLAMARIRADEATNALVRFGQEQITANIAIGAAAGKPKGLRDTSGGPTRGIGEGISGGARSFVPASRPAKPRGGGDTGRAAGGSSAPRVSEEQKTQDALAKIAQDGANRLIEIDRRAAEARAQAQRELIAQIATMQADRISEQESDDLDLVGASEEQAAKLISRERAQAAARIASEQAVSEAKAMAAAGDAETAQKVLDIRENQIGKQEALDQKYLDKQAELAGDDTAQAMLQQQYDEATAALASAAETRIGLAQEEARQKIAAAEQEKLDVITKAQEQAAGVKGASESQRDAVLASLNAQIGGAAAWASAVSSASASVISDAHAAAAAISSIPSMPSSGGGGDAPAGGGGGGTKAAGGGTFLTKGRTTLTVGDNPGGAELVHVVPLSGRGQTRVGSGMLRLAGGGTVIPEAGAVKSLVDTGLAGGAAAKKAASGGGGGKGASDAVAAIKDQLDAARQAIDLLAAIAELRDLASRPQFPIDDMWMWGVAKEAAQIATIVRATAIPMTEEATKELGFYFDAAGGAIDLLSSVADLRATFAASVSGEGFPISDMWVWGLAKEASEIRQIVASTLVPTTEGVAEGISTYADSVGSAVSLLSDIASLRADMAEAKDTPLNAALMQSLADDAKQAYQIITSSLIPTTEGQTEALSLYADAASSAISVLNDTQSLRDAVDAPRTPISEAYIAGLADEARRATEIMRARLVPTTQEQADAASLYADAVSSSVGALSSVIDLSGLMFDGYVSPTNAQLGMLATDAQRVTMALNEAAVLIGTDGLEASKAYGEALGATFGALKDELLFFDALKSGDFRLDVGNLKAFEKDSILAIDSAGRIAAKAAQIPASDIAALQAVTAAQTGLYDSLIKLAAIPMGGGGAAQYGGGGGSTTITNYVTVNTAPGMNVNQVADAVVQKIGQSVGGRR